MRTPATSSELEGALAKCRTAFTGVAIISGLVNLLYLTGSVFMLEVYDRVIPSRSLPTLIGLATLAFALYAFQGALETMRSRVLARIGTLIDADLSGKAFALSSVAPLHGVALAEASQPLRDLDTVRAFLSGAGPSAFFDLPWLPIFVAICFVFHPLIGSAAVGGALVLVLLTLVTDARTRGPSRASTQLLLRRDALAEDVRRNAEVLSALGMRGQFAERWQALNRSTLASQQRAADVTSGLGSIAKVFRMALQSGVLGLGAYLVINGQATGGIIIASSILVARALAPVDLAIANWRGFVAARQSWRRLSDQLSRQGAERTRHALPPPVATLSVEGVTVVPPGTQRAVVEDVTLRVAAGQALGVIGASASGKSSLVRAMIGVWTPARGRVRLDGAALDQWSPESLGRHLGYLSQDVELFAGTVGENIGRFDSDAPPEQVIEAAKAAGAHDMIVRLPHGYNTPLGSGGSGLSAGQKQRVGLARALYGDPFLVVLDEPNANLDAEGEGALTTAIAGVKARGGICIVVAHRPSALAAVDLVLTLAAGRVAAFGPRDEVLKRMLRPAAVAAGPAPAQPGFGGVSS